MYDDHEDSQLVELAQNGDVLAVAALHDRHWQAIFTYMFYRVSDRVSAEDLTADVFVRMVEALDRYQQRHKTILPWLYTIARNLVTDHYRRNDREPTLISLDERRLTDYSNPAEIVSNKFDAECLKKALQHLTEIQRQVIIGKFVEGRSNQEVAELTERSEGAIKSLQHRALAALRRAIEKDDCYEI